MARSTTHARIRYEDLTTARYIAQATDRPVYEVLHEAILALMERNASNVRKSL